MHRLVYLLLLATATYAWRLPFRVKALNGAAGVSTMAPMVTQGGQATVFVDNVYFVANISIGTPPQLFSVVLDTSTADLFVPDALCYYQSGVCGLPECQGSLCSQNCPNKTCCLQPKAGALGSTMMSTMAPKTSTCYGKTQYNSSASTTYVKQQHVVNINGEGYGKIDGFTGIDTVRLGDDPTELITIPNCAFTQAVSVSSKFGNLTGIDGVLGLAFTTAAVSKNPPPFITAVQNGNVADSVFSIWLEDQGQSDDLGTAGVAYWGGYDDVNHCSKNKQMWVLSQAVQWGFTVTNFTAGKYVNTKNWQAVVDSASLYVHAPTTIAVNVLSQLGLNANTPLPTMVPCNTTISFNLGLPNSGIATIATKNIVVPVGNGQCMLMMKEHKSQFKLGMPFLRGRCTYFDTKRNLMGYADALKH